MAKLGNILDNENLIDDTTDSVDKTYSSTKIEELLATFSTHRGVAIYVQVSEPTDQEINDIWIKI